VLRNGANDGSLVLKAAQPGTPGSLALERMQKMPNGRNWEYIGGSPRKQNGNSGLWKVGREK
jgi:hypothetical protein